MGTYCVHGDVINANEVYKKEFIIFRVKEPSKLLNATKFIHIYDIFFHFLALCSLYEEERVREDFILFRFVFAL